MSDSTRSLNLRRRALLKGTGAAALLGAVVSSPVVLRDGRARLLAALGLERGATSSLLRSAAARRELSRAAATWVDRAAEFADARSDRELRAVVASAIREDYIRGDLACVDGWLLARTEALVLALTTITDI
jgi:hypothetical protein